MLTSVINSNNNADDLKEIIKNFSFMKEVIINAEADNKEELLAHLSDLEDAHPEIFGLNYDHGPTC